MIDNCDVEDDPKKVDIEGHHEVLASAWTMQLQMEMLLHLSQKRDDKNHENSIITSNAEKHMTWIRDNILTKKQPTHFTSHIVNSAILFCSNLVTMNICNLNLVHMAIQASSDFLEQGMQMQ